MADDRSDTRAATTGEDVHDDDELAEVLAAELERYATGSVPTVPRPTVAEAPPLVPLAVPGIDATAGPEPETEPSAEEQERASARRAAEVERAVRRAAPELRGEPAPESFRRGDRPTVRREPPEPVLQPTPLPTADDLPVKRRSGFRPPPSAVEAPPVEPLDRVLPTGPVTLPEATASLLDAIISDATGPVDVLQDQPHARHAAPVVEPEPQTGPLPTAPRHSGPAGLPDGLYEEWEQSLRAIGRPPALWEQDDEVVPTGGDPDLPTVAIPVQTTGPVFPTAPQPTPVDVVPAESAPVAPSPADPAPHRGAHALPLPDVEDAPPQRRRSGRRRADAPPDALPGDTAPVARPASIADREETTGTAPVAPQDVFVTGPSEPFTTGPHDAVAATPYDAFTTGPSEPASFSTLAPASLPTAPVEEFRAPGPDVDDEGIDEVAAPHPQVSAATTGAVDLPQVEPRPRTAPVLIERVRTAILQLPTVPPSPTGTGAAAIVGRWFGAFASPFALVLAFAVAAAGGGPASAAVGLVGALLAAPAIVRSGLWAASVSDDAAMQESSVLGAAVGRAVAVVLLLARIGAAAAVVLLAGAVAGAWADRTGALGLGSSNAALLGSTAVALLALLCAALPVRATAVLTLIAAVLGTVGTVLVALVLAPNGGAAVAATPSGAVAGGVAGLVGVGLLLVLCGADVARWRTDLANPVSTAVAGVVAAVCGVLLLGAATLIAARLTGGGDPVDDFAGALSDASASVLAAPMLVILLGSSITLPALLLRSAGASAARLIGAGRPVRLGAVAAGLLALAVALGVLASGVDAAAAVLAVAALCGAPVAAWAGLLAVGPRVRRPAVAGGVLAVAVLLGWLLSDGLVPGATSPVLAAIGLAGTGPAVGLVVALALGAVAGLAAGRAGHAVARPAPGPADTVEG